MTERLLNLIRDAPELNETSKKNYISVANRLVGLVGHSLEWVMANPTQSLLVLKEELTTNASTLANFCVMVCKLYALDGHDTRKRFPNSYKLWQRYLRHYRNKEENAYKESKFTDKQLKNYIGWDEVQSYYCRLKKDTMTHTTQQSNQEYLLFSLLLNMNAKRADLGNIRIFETDPRLETTNYLYFKPVPTLVLTEYKTSKKFGVIKEPLCAELVKDIKQSLNLFPRSHLILSLRLQQPYEKNNSYSQYVKRVFEKHFGRSMGVSLWRSVYISANVDFNDTPYEVLERNALYKGHSLAQEFMSYRKLAPGSTTTKLFRRPASEQGAPVNCKP